MNVIAVVHAKGKSERLLNKNVKLLGDKPLVAHAILNALGCKRINKVIIDSDSAEILEIGEHYGAVPLLRPKELATNKTTGDELAYWQATNFPNSDVIIQMVPTSPFIKSKTVDEELSYFTKVPSAWEWFRAEVGVKLVSPYIWEKDNVSGTYYPTYYVDNKIPNSQDLTALIVETTGFYMFRTQYTLKERRRVFPHRTGMFKLSDLEAIDINTEEDFDFAEIVWRGLNDSTG